MLLETLTKAVFAEFKPDCKMLGEGKKARKKNSCTRHGLEEIGSIRQCQGRTGLGGGDKGPSKELFTSSIFFLSFLSSLPAFEMSVLLVVTF